MAYLPRPNLSTQTTDLPAVRLRSLGSTLLSKMSIIPVDVLIDENGKVVDAHYCKDTVDHLPIDRLISFSKGE